VQIILADPEGSSLCNKIEHNVCYTYQQSERTIRKHRYDSIVEGVGLDRITANFDQGMIDKAYTIPDQRLVQIAHWLLRYEGLFVGSSSALNIATTIHALQQPQQSPPIRPNSTIVTVCCDYGSRHLSRFWNEKYLVEYGLIWPSNEEIDNLFCVQ